MIPVPTGVRVWLATGHTDMRKGFPGLALLVQETLRRDPHSGHLFVFRGRRGDRVSLCVLWLRILGDGGCFSQWNQGRHAACGQRSPAVLSAPPRW